MVNTLGRMRIAECGMRNGRAKPPRGESRKHKAESSNKGREPRKSAQSHPKPHQCDIRATPKLP
jgi:hypothetical protein